MHLLRHSLLVTTLLIAVPTDSLRSNNIEPMGDVPPTSAQPATHPPHNLRPLPTAAANRNAPSPRPALTAAEREVVEWAFSRFDDAGLDLPEVAIQFTADADDCDGEQGVYRRRGATHSVTVCVPDRQGAAIEHRRRRTLLHELAHAWDHATLTDSDRELLLPALEATDWYDPDAAWDQRGVERLAETLTWGLLDQKRRPLKIDTDCAAIHVDFITITGSAVLGPIDRICEIDLTMPDPAELAELVDVPEEFADLAR